MVDCFNYFRRLNRSMVEDTNLPVLLISFTIFRRRNRSMVEDTNLPVF